MAHDAVGLGAFSALYGAGVAALPAAHVHPASWTALFMACLVAAVPLWRRWPQAGLSIAGYSLLLAGIFLGANRGLDALNGPDRATLDVARSLGGLELWFVLCPGVSALGLGGWLRALAVARGPV